jgi:hypothetical protein
LKNNKLHQCWIVLFIISGTITLHEVALEASCGSNSCVNFAQWRVGTVGSSCFESLGSELWGHSGACCHSSLGTEWCTFGSIANSVEGSVRRVMANCTKQCATGCSSSSAQLYTSNSFVYSSTSTRSTCTRSFE